MQNFPNSRISRDEYAASCREEAARCEGEARSYSAGSNARTELLIEASHLLDRAAQALV